MQDDDRTSPVANTFLPDVRAAVVIYHRDGAEVVPLYEGKPMVVGRALPSDTTIPEKSLSRRHACFELTESGVWVEDLGSTNGTKVDGERISERVRIDENTDVRIGAARVTVHRTSPGGAEALRRGLLSYDLFSKRLAEEVSRAETFNRPLSVLFVRSLDNAHVGQWSDGVRAQLRPVDAIAMYSSSVIAICLVEVAPSQAQRTAERLTTLDSAQLVCGLASLPTHAASADELLTLARQASYSATRDQPFVAAPEAADGAPAHTAAEPLVCDDAMREVYKLAERIAQVELPVLILGETGSGKEVLAQHIHLKGPRAKAPIRCVNCAALPESLIESTLFGHEKGAFTGAVQQAKGIFEVANGGTVMLDEVGELSAPAQASLLRVLETKRLTRVGGNQEIDVDVRIIGATHRDLEQLSTTGAFRSDLYYRLNGVSIIIPPLRERTTEIIPLAKRFLERASTAGEVMADDIDAAAQQQLLAYAWPGNIRELRNVMERAAVVSGSNVVTPADLPASLRASKPDKPSADEMPALDDDLPIKERLSRYERHLILAALEECNWNQTRAAKRLQMPLRTLVNRIKSLGLKKRYEAD